MADEKGPVEIVQTPVELDYTYTAGQAATRFLKGVEQGKFLGQRCPVDGLVYVASRGSSPKHGVPTGPDTVEVSDKGTLISFSIVRIPSANLSVEPPFAAISVLLDGADSHLMHVLDECPLEEVRMGMRVEAVWLPKDQWTASMQNVTHFRPTGEPDAPFDSYKDHL